MRNLRTGTTIAMLAVNWRDNVANVRLHDRLRQRPIDRFAHERTALRPLPCVAYNTDELVITEVRPTARIDFDSQPLHCSASIGTQNSRRPCQCDCKFALSIKGNIVACHQRSYGRRRIDCRCGRIKRHCELRRRRRASDLEQRASKPWAPVAIEFPDFSLGGNRWRSVRPSETNIGVGATLRTRECAGSHECRPSSTRLSMRPTWKPLSSNSVASSRLPSPTQLQPNARS